MEDTISTITNSTVNNDIARFLLEAINTLGKNVTTPPPSKPIKIWWKMETEAAAKAKENLIKADSTNWHHPIHREKPHHFCHSVDACLIPDATHYPISSSKRRKPENQGQHANHWSYQK